MPRSITYSPLAETLSSLWLKLPRHAGRLGANSHESDMRIAPAVIEAPLMPVRLQAIELTSSAINAYTYQYNDKAGCLRTARSLDRALTHGDVMTTLIR